MQRLIAFIEHNIHIMLFVLLQAMCGVLLFSLNPYQQASFTHSAAFITDKSNELSSTVTDYFNLQQQNNLLQAQVSTQFKNDARSSLFFMNDTITLRDTSRHKLFNVVPAEVVYNTIYKASNIFIINKGIKNGIQKNMGVISSQGLAGIVLQSNENYSSVMSLLHINMNVIPTINNLEYYTGLKWDNANPQTLKITGLNKLEEIKVGDKVYTGRSSLLFPAGILIGEISKLETSPSSQYFTTHVKTATNFRNMDYVYVIVNKDIDQLSPLLLDND
jgi:rod shape-determining protein MreC